MYLNEKTKKVLEQSLGKTIQELAQMDADEEMDFVAEVAGSRPVFSKLADWRMKGRGNPLLAGKRIFTMADVDKRIMEMK